MNVEIYNWCLSNETGRHCSKDNSIDALDLLAVLYPKGMGTTVRNSGSQVAYEKSTVE